MIFVTLFMAFLKAGFFTFGGGLVIIPFLQRLVDTYGWFSNEELSTIVALSQMTPGALGVNMATYAGIMASGIMGGVVATMGLCVVSLILPPLVMRCWQRIQGRPIVQSIFNALKAAVAGLIVAVFFAMSADVFKDGNEFVFKPMIAFLFLVAIVVNMRFKINNIIFIVAFGLLGLFLKL